MPHAVDILEERVAQAAELIAGLRSRIKIIEGELVTARATAHPANPQPPPAAPAPSLSEEVERLRAERAVVLERIRGLLREIDRVSW